MDEVLLEPELEPETAVQRVLARARRYVEHETPSRAAAAITALSELVEADLAAVGASVERHDAPGLGRNLTVRVPGAENDLDPVLILAHIDTVHPTGTLARLPFRIENGLAYGPGIYDMKTGLACVVESLAWLHENGRAPRRPVRMLVTCDEEIGSHSVRERIQTEARVAAAVLVPEPCLPDGGAKTSRKGVETYRIEARGRAAHAGTDGATAVSAIAALVHGLAEVMDLADHDRGTTINIGLIGGGSASNVVAGEAWAVVDVRLAEAEEGERVRAGLMALAPRHPGAAIAARATELRPPLVRTADVVRLYEHARRVAAGIGFALTEGASGGGSDGSIAAAAGAPTLDGLGPLGAGAHSDHEHIVLADLPFRLAFMTRLLQTL
jgi:glutamate carboxypeptidase